MRKLWVTNIVFFVLLSLNAQEPIDKYRSALDAMSAYIPEDQVFIHTDRNLYHPGDTIYFQSYIQDRVLQECGTISNSLYAILQNSGNELIDSARFRISSSLAPGYLTIPDTVSPGYYRIVSYTSLMQNYDPDYCYTSWLKIDELNPNSVIAEFSFDKTSYSSNDTAEVLIRLSDQLGDELRNEEYVYTLVYNGVPGEYYKVMTNRRGESTLRLFMPDSMDYCDVSVEINLRNKNYLTRKSIPRDIKRIKLSFLPEGGTFTYGIKQRLAFNAIAQDGEQLYISGIVRNSQGQFIDSLKSGELGPGIFDFTPVSGEKYYAEIHDYPDYSFDLPLPSNFMPVLRADCSEQSVSVSVSSPDAASRNDFLVFRKNNNILAFQELDSTYHAFRFDTKKLPQGTASFLLLDGNLNPVAERMVYINSDKKVNVRINPSYDFYMPGQEAEISISFLDTGNTVHGSVFSVAVVDSTTAFYPDLLAGNIEERFLFDELFYNNLPHDIKIRGLTNIDQEDLDILLLTYGWRRFTWLPLTAKMEEAERVYYDMLKVVINDSLTKRKTRELSKNSDNLFVLSLDDSKIFDLTRIDKKSYYFLFDSLYQNANNIMITPADSIRGYLTSASVEFPTNQDYYYSVSSSTIKPVLNADDEFPLIADFEINPYSIMRLEIEEVSVKASRKKAYVNEFEEDYKNFSTLTLDREDMEVAPDFESLLRRLFPIKLDPKGKTIYLRYNSGISDGAISPPALFVLDGIPIETSYELISYIQPEEIHSITALRGLYGFQRYGHEAEGGVVFVETKRKHAGGKYEYKDDNTIPDRGDLGRVINLFRPHVEFYTPDVKNMSEESENWLRPTLFWNSELVFDGTNPVTIKYPNHLKKGTVIIKLNGVTEDSRPFSGEYRYKIK